jgi:hypothetical protein
MNKIRVHVRRRKIYLISGIKFSPCGCQVTNCEGRCENLGCIFPPLWSTRYADAAQGVDDNIYKGIPPNY